MTLRVDDSTGVRMPHPCQRKLVDSNYNVHIARSELKHEYSLLRSQQIEAEIRLLDVMEVRLLESLMTLLGPSKLVRWLFTTHERLFFCRPIDYIEANGSAVTGDILMIARD